MTPKEGSSPPTPPVEKRDPAKPPARGTRGAGTVEDPGAPVVAWKEGQAADAGTGSGPARPATEAPRKFATPPPKPPAPVPFPPDDLKEACEVWIARYPERAAALIPILHLAQSKYGWLSPEVQAGVARYLAVSDAHVRGVVTFYTMFNTKPVGRHHLQVCRTLSCWLRGAGEITQQIERRTGLKPGQSDAEGRFTVSEVECLGLCEVAPALFVNQTAHSNVTEAALDKILDGCK